MGGLVLSVGSTPASPLGIIIREDPSHLKLPGGKMMPFEVFLLYTVKNVNLALREYLSNEDILKRNAKNPRVRERAN